MKERLRAKGQVHLANMLESVESDLVADGQASAAKEEPPSIDAESLLAELKKIDPIAEKEDYFDPDSGTWDTDGLQEDLDLARQRQVARQPEAAAAQPEAAAAQAEAAAAQPEAAAAQAEAAAAQPEVEPKPMVEGPDPQSMLEELRRLDPDASKDDYYDGEADLWDLAGLEDDLQLARTKGSEVAPVEDASEGQETVEVSEPGEGPEALLSELIALDPEASREDYFDEESGWDVEGLKADLDLQRLRGAGPPQGAAEAEPASAPAEASGPSPEALWAELASLDGQASKEDYFDGESGEWDTDGLQDDLVLARQAKVAEASPAPAVAEASQPQVEPKVIAEEGGLEDPEALLAHLSTFDPDVTKQDYFDDESGEWDVEGLKEDLRLAKEAVAASVQAPTAANAAPTQAAEEEADPLSAGDYVMAKYEGEGAGWYTAVVVRDIGDGSFELKWDEDSTETPVSRDKIRVLPPITVGASVFAIWEEDGGWYDGVVTKDGGSGNFVVKYDEDQSEATLPKAKIRVKVEPPKEPQFWWAPYAEGDPPLPPGEKVQALWRDGDYEGYHEGNFVKDNGDGTFLVKWEVDESETPVKREEVRTYKERIPVSQLTIGQKCAGIVTNIQTFGAFVDFGCERDGLVHISRLSQQHILSVEDFVSVGQTVTVWVSLVIKDGEKIDLTMVEGYMGGKANRFDRKEVDLTAFVDVPSDKWLTGTVNSITPFGLFVSVESPSGAAGKGLVHCSEIRDGYVTDPFSEAQIGQEVQVRVTKVDLEAKKMGLSMKPV